jgi:hypothetical protein
MQYLRSTSSHNISDDFHALRAFARATREPRSAFLQPYSRPTLELFNRHAAIVLKRTGVPERMRRGRVHTVQRLRHGWRLQVRSVDPDMSDYSVDAGRVVLAVGRSEQLRIPDWARLWRDHAPPSSIGRVRHVFDFHAGAKRTLDPMGTLRDDHTGTGHGDHICVVGGGVTGVQTALSLRASRVTLLTPHPITVKHFDSDPCYMGPRCLRDFLALEDARERRAALQAARTPGTIPWDVAESLENAEKRGRIRVLEGTVRGISSPGAAAEPIRLATDDGVVEADRVVLATGFSPSPPVPDLLNRIVRDAGLELNNEGYPAVDETLQWAPGFFVSSAAAELELGPMGPNIYGAHAAARRIFPVLMDTMDEPRSKAPWVPLREMSPVGRGA